MTSTFLLPLAMGTCEGAGRDLMIDAFGIVAVVAMTPLIIIQLMGLIYGRRMKTTEKIKPEMEPITIADAGEIIEYEEGHSHE
jgi:hypothetical protein